MPKKSQLRNSSLIKRNNLSQSQVESESLKITNRCLGLPIWDGFFYHLYLSIPEKKEVDTSFLLTVLQGKDKDIVLPKVGRTKDLTHILLTDTTELKLSTLGIPEPISGLEVKPSLLDVIFVPLLCFDLFGHRIGYGGGYYDRFLSKCRPDARKIGLSFFGPEAKISDIEPTDIPLDGCVTPEAYYAF
jgi:5-formyltetrahydrofolate cyclo-ligase